MKAVRCHAFGPADGLSLDDIPAPVPGANQVVVTVKAAGANFPDALMVEGKYQAKPALPFTPGCEFAGIVSRTGPGVTHVRAGDPVVGYAPSGAFAEEVLAEAASVVLLPADADLVLHSVLQVAYGTALHALLDRARIVAGETLLVLGAAGGVGLAAVRLGRLLGATVIAAASTDAKLEACRTHGAEHTINYDAEDLRERVRALTGGRGVEVVFDPVGGTYAAPALRCLAWNGRYLVVGFATGEIPRVPLNLPLLKGYSILGVFWGEFARRDPAANAGNTRQLLRWVADGELKPPVSARYPLARAGDALAALTRREVTGKVVIVP
jgi:NADPH2:quinone reductase